MNDAIFCPFCQRKNPKEATECVHCGISLSLKDADPFSTIGIDQPPSLFPKVDRPCETYLDELPEQALALFVMDKQEPIIVEDGRKVIFGRKGQGADKHVLDLSGYATMALGISRQHAQIRLVDDNYILEDLGSTNGTWLNRQRLNAHQPYPLHNDDQIWLGPLKLTVCFHAPQIRPGIEILLKPHPSSAATGEKLTLQYLAAHVMPYLQAITDIQSIRQACKGKESQDVTIHTINEQGTNIVVHLDGVAETVQLLQALLNPWRHEHGHVIGLDEPEPTLQDDLTPVAIKMLEDIDVDPSELDAWVKKLLPSLTILATSHLELFFEPDLVN